MVIFNSYVKLPEGNVFNVISQNFSVFNVVTCFFFFFFFRHSRHVLDQALFQYSTKFDQAIVGISGLNLPA